MKHIFRLILLVLFLTGISSGLSAATITVDTVGDRNNPCPLGATITLREAARCAQPGDTIRFHSSLNGDTILIDNDLGPIAIFDDLVIIGNDTTNTIIDGEDSTRIFVFGSDLATIEIWGIMFQRGFGDQSNPGGAIFNFSDLTVNNCSFHDNEGDAGAGICNFGVLEVNDCNFYNNYVDYIAQGGAIYNHGFAFTTVRRSTFSNNTTFTEDASSWGGAIAFMRPTFGELTVEDCRFYGNESITQDLPTTAAGFGGAIAIYATSIGGSVDSRVRIRNCEFIGNKTIGINNQGSVAGAVMFSTGGELEVTNSRFTGNQTDGGGLGRSGALALWRGSSTIQGCTFDENKVLNPLIDGEAGVMRFVYNANVTIRNSTFTGNESEFGGAVNNQSSGAISIDHSTFAGNHATENGGGIRNESGYKLDLSNTLVATNTAGTMHPDGENAGFLNTLGYNLIGDTSGMNMVPQTGDILGNSGAPVDPQLDPLADNGGPTQTMALQFGSPASDAANPASMGPDQRGEAVYNGRKDIGAYEIPCDISVPGVSVRTVTDLSDAGTGTLRDIIERSCACDTVLFDPLLNTDTIKLDSQIVIDKKLVVLGNDTLNTIIDGQAKDRIFEIEDGDSVQIWRLTMQNGRHGFGGGIFNRGTLLLAESKMSDNHTFGPSSWPLGGAVYSSNGLTATGCSFIRNRAESSTTPAQGGAIYSFGAPLSINKCKFLENEISGNLLAGWTIGGAIVNLNTPMTINSSHFEGNRANAMNGLVVAGGAFYSQSGAVNMDSCVFTNNSAQADTSTWLIGGAVCNLNSDLNIHASRIENNTIEGVENVTAAYAGGLYSQNGPMEVTDCRFSGNQILSHGNTAVGGALMNFGKMTISESSILGNKVMTDSLAFGGGIICSGDTLSITNSTIAGNDLISTLDSNAYGGGIGNSGGYTDLTNVQLTGNKVSAAFGHALGGGMWGAGSKLINTTVSGNRADGLVSKGGGIFDSVFVNMTNSIVWDDSADTDSEISSPVLEVTYSLIKDQAPAGDGNLDGGNPFNDPLFVDPRAPSAAPTSEGDYHQQNCSPVINIGRNDSIPAGLVTDLDGQTRIVDDVDFGPFEIQVPAVDGDNDGFVTPCDCDDDDPAINPSAIEICGNDVDEDCDGIAQILDDAGYCCAFGEDDPWYINQVQAPINGVNNMSFNDNGYGDYTGEVLSINPWYSAIYLLLHPGGSPSMKHWRVYADWNKDNVFSPSEKVIDYCTYGPFGQFIGVPAGFSGSTRMRVVMKKVNAGCSPGDIPADACGEIGAGEVEDYTIDKPVPTQYQPKAQNQVELFPNPFGDEMYLIMDPALKSGHDLELTLVNAQGQTVLRRTVESAGEPIRIEGSHLPSGSYLLHLNTGEEMVVKTVVKQ